MKTITSIIAIIISNISFAQLFSPTFDKQAEIFCMTENTFNNTNFTFSPIGLVWDVEWPSSSSKIFSIDTDGSSAGGIYTVDPNDNDPGGFNYIASSESAGFDFPDFGFSIYKLSVNNKFILLDWRDTRYGSYTYCNGHCADIWIRFNFSTNSFSYSNSQFSPNWIAVTTGQLLKIWELKNQGTPNTEDVPNFWENCLILIKNSNNYPHLVWGPYPGIEVLGYNFYKKLTTSSGTITSVIFTTSTEYIDTNFEIDPKFGSDYVEYWVKAKINSSLESLESNHCTTKGDSYIQWKMNEGNDLETKIISEYLLNPNYPNPFNPSTNITYQLPKKGHVVLKIYNTLGKEVAELINETKEEGTYSVTFIGDNLPSGMYFYKIQSNEFVDVKKMLLVK